MKILNQLLVYSMQNPDKLSNEMLNQMVQNKS